MAETPFARRQPFLFQSHHLSHFDLKNLDQIPFTDHHAPQSHWFTTLHRHINLVYISQNREPAQQPLNQKSSLQTTTTKIPQLDHEFTAVQP